ncbi:hypothetical protein L218DRAFT_693852 [Marasmius fiardii PR-910]|nr:hypothetical protein L218DRAFT_693852 [Marasmius fiardii PR-910]
MSTLLKSQPTFFKVAHARYYPGKYPRPKPGTSERPPYRAPDPLINNPVATVTSLPEDDLTFIHRPPPTSPSPFSYTTNPVSPLLQPKKLPTVVAKIRHLRLSKPEVYTRGRLAKEFGVTQRFVGLIAAVSKAKRKELVSQRDALHGEGRAKWSDKKRLVEDIRKKRRTFW